jgi:uncharacterized membrane protein
MAKTIEYDIKVSTDGAVKSIAGLEQELAQLQTQFKGLEIGSAEFNKVGNRIREVQSEIKTLDERFEGLGIEQKGAAIVDSFNVIAGSIGAVTGAMVALGIESKAVDDIEKKLIGLITVVSSLREVSNGLAGAQKTLIPLFGKVGNALKAAFASNPIGLITVAVVALTAAIYALVKAQDDEEESLKKLAKAREDYQKRVVADEEQSLKLLQARGATQVEIAQEEVKIAKRRAEEAANEAARQKGINQFSEETKAAVDAQLAATRNLELAEANLSKARLESSAKEAEDRKKAKEDRAKELAELAAKRKEFLDKEFEFYIKLIEISNDVSKRGIEKLNESLDKSLEATEKRIAQTTGVQKQIQSITLTATEESTKTSADKVAAYLELVDTRIKYFLQSTAVQTAVGAAQAANDIFSNLEKAQDQTTKEGFEKSKKFKIAQVVTTSAQASFDAFAGAQKFNAVVPGLGTAIGIALVASIIAASKQSIAQIKNSQFDSASTPSSPAGGGSVSIPTTSGGGLNQQNLGGFVGGPAGTPSIAPTEPIRAYVVSNDVENGLQANANIRRRRRLGPG